MREDGERLLTLDEDFPDQREYTTVVDYGGTGVRALSFSRHPAAITGHGSSSKIIVFVGTDPCVCPVRHPELDSGTRIS